MYLSMALIFGNSINTPASHAYSMPPAGVAVRSDAWDLLTRGSLSKALSTSLLAMSEMDCLPSGEVARQVSAQAFGPKTRIEVRSSCTSVPMACQPPCRHRRQRRTPYDELYAPSPVPPNRFPQPPHSLDSARSPVSFSAQSSA